jgi:CRP/FNR family cyclic AMP-dependent transcriptional regulator
MLEYMQKVPLFSKLNTEQLVAIANICNKKTFKAGTVLFQEKEFGSVFYIVASGSVKIYTSAQSQEEKILSIFKSGDSFGELSLIDGQPRSASAATLEESTLITLLGDEFIEILRANFEICFAIMQELSHRLRDTNQHVHDLTFLDARTRVIKNLILLANKHGKRNGNTISVKMVLNYDEISLMAGVQKGTLMQVIRDLQEKGIIILTPNDLTIDLAKLRG